MESDQELDPDPLVRGTDPGIRIRTKMSRITNTDKNQWMNHILRSQTNNGATFVPEPETSLKKPGKFCLVSLSA